MKYIAIYGTGCDEDSAWLPFLKSEIESGGGVA